jgi:dCTP deaminase
MDVSRQSISSIVNGHQAISREMANRLARMTGHTPGYWLQDDIADQPATSVGRSLLQGVLNDNQIKKAIEDRVIDVDPYDADLVQSASIDLRLGAFIIHADGSVADISGGRSFGLAPMKTINVQTKESIRLPRNIIGRVGPMMSVARFGILLAHGLQIDPGYGGHLEFCLFNGGQKDYPLRSGEAFVSIEFVALSAEPSREKRAPEKDRVDVVKGFGGEATSFECDRLVREALRPFVKVYPRGDGVIAEILDVTEPLRSRTEKIAVENTIEAALVGFREAVDSNHGPLRAKHQAFLSKLAAELYLDADKLKLLADCLGLDMTEHTIKLANKLLTVPKGSSISLEQLASLLKKQIDELVTQLVQYPREDHSFRSATK